MYDPTTGRFLTEDPIGFAGGDPNLFRYVGNSPTNRTDPSGLMASDRSVFNPKPGDPEYTIAEIAHDVSKDMFDNCWQPSGDQLRNPGAFGNEFEDRVWQKIQSGKDSKQWHRNVVVDKDGIVVAVGDLKGVKMEPGYTQLDIVHAEKGYKIEVGKKLDSDKIKFFELKSGREYLHGNQLKRQQAIARINSNNKRNNHFEIDPPYRYDNGSKCMKENPKFKTREGFFSVLKYVGPALTMLAILNPSAYADQFNTMLERYEEVIRLSNNKSTQPQDLDLAMASLLQAAKAYFQNFGDVDWTLLVTYLKTLNALRY